MAKEDDLHENIETTSTKSSDLNNSLVDKVKSLIPETITKWFGKNQSVIRRRDSDSDDESFDLEQPPSKRAKMPDVPDEIDTRSEKLLNGSPPNMSTSLKSTELLNNIRPRQSFRHSSYNLERPINREFSYTRKKIENSEPVAGPSGVQYLNTSIDNNEVYFTSNIQKSQNIDVNDEKKTESGQSTSGCSSMAYKNAQATPFVIPEVQNAVEKQIEGDNSPVNTPSAKRARLDETSKSTVLKQSIRTLFPENVFSPRLISPSLASRRPSFNASTFSSPKLIDKTLTTERITTSPFYAGRTRFGGAAAYRKFREVISPQTAFKNAIQLKPTNEQDMKDVNSVSMSQTARRILDALEHFSTPISDARKIPRQNISSKNLNSKAQTKPLIIPTVPDILQIKRDKLIERKRKIDEEGAAKITETTRAPSVNLLPKTDPPFQIPKLPPKETVTFKQSEQIKMNITTPLNTEKSFVSQTVSKPVEIDKKSEEEVTFKFSTPIKINNVNPKAFESINNFKFSKPLSARLRDLDGSKTELSHNNLSNFKFKSPANKNTNNDFLFKVPSSIPNKTPFTTNPTPVSTGGELASLDKFKPPANTWECSTCMVRNKLSTDKCVACETARQTTCPSNTSTKNTSSVSIFSSQTNMSDDKWKCTSCSVENSVKNQHCVACTALKPGTNLSNTHEVKPIFGFNTDKSDNWKCKTCMTNNGKDITKCSNCQALQKLGQDNSIKQIFEKSPKSGFGKEFQKKSNEWECPSCMVRNVATKLSCVCCEAPKPGCTPQPSKNECKLPATFLPFKFGIDKADVKTPATSTTTPTFSFGVKSTTSADISSQNTSGFTFGTKVNTDKQVEPVKSQMTITTNAEESKNLTADVTSTNSEVLQKKANTKQWECPNCWVKNTDDKQACACCNGAKPGATSGNDKSENSVSSTSSFKFGIDKVDSKTSEALTTSATSKFTFGIKPASSTVTSTSNTIATTTQMTPSTGFSFVSSQTDKKLFNVKETVPSNTLFSVHTPKESEPPKVAATSTVTSNSISPTITFGKAPNSAPTISITTTPTLVFGNSSNTSNLFTVPNGPATTTTTSVFGSPTVTTTTTTSVFGSPAVTTTTTTPVFGSPAVTTTTTTPVFGSPAVTTTTTTSVFGSPAVTTTSNTTSIFTNNGSSNTSGSSIANNTFGAFGSTETFPKPTPFGSNTTNTAPVFGSSLPTNNFTFSADKPEEKKALFSFGNTTQENSGTTLPKTPFSFNPNTNVEFGTKSTTSATGGFTFNATKSSFPPFGGTPTTNMSSNLFGGLTSQPAQQTTNPSFGAASPVFGASNPTNPPTFQFGSTVQQPAQVFSFGSSNQTGQSATPAFGSNQPTPSQNLTIPTFNPNTKPVFNFTSGGAPPAFTAQPAPGNTLATSQRKIKRAVRRTRGGPS